MTRRRLAQAKSHLLHVLRLDYLYTRTEEKPARRTRPLPPSPNTSDTSIDDDAGNSDDGASEAARPPRVPPPPGVASTYRIPTAPSAQSLSKRLDYNLDHPRACTTPRPVNLMDDPENTWRGDLVKDRHDHSERSNLRSDVPVPTPPLAALFGGRVGMTRTQPSSKGRPLSREGVVGRTHGSSWEGVARTRG